MFIDAHAHLDAESFTLPPEEILRRAFEAGVDQLIVVGCGVERSRNALALAQRHPGRLFAVVGVHPHDVAGMRDADLEAIAALAREPEVVGVGETGLDYHYDHSPRDVQQEVFARHLELAREVGKPVVIHTREAEEDTLSVLERVGRLPAGGQLHCFTSSRELALRGVEEHGFHVSFSGVLTFANADPLRAICAELPEERLLIETDCPYLTPAPFRGIKNEPALVSVVAGKMAELRGLEVAELARRTSAHCRALFGLPPPPPSDLLAFASGRCLHLRVDHPEATAAQLLEAAGRWPEKKLREVELLTLGGEERAVLAEAARGWAAARGLSLRPGEA
ncbi:MAG: TatD family hydrolase [Deltaproteobacteria bacterium]|nr:TatD family hydrolase [Deltaproteobacteria bacterium]